MTDAQLEAAARRYCRLLGVEPDTVVASRLLDDGAVVGPRVWEHWALPTIKTTYYACLAIEQAIDEGDATALDGENEPENTKKT